MNVPFRWSLQRPEFLGSLREGERAESYANFLDELRSCCVRVLSLSQDCSLIFVGRSPESVHDYLSGICSGSSWERRLLLFNISLRDCRKYIRSSPRSLSTAKRLAEHSGLAPWQIASAPHPLLFVDLVASGSTFGTLLELLLLWAQEEQVDQKAVLRRIQFLGITWGNKPSPHTYRWFQHARWTKRLRPSQIKNISIPPRLWNYLGNQQEKTTLSNHPQVWGDSTLATPSRQEKHLQALRLAWDIHRHARTVRERTRFLTEAQEQPSCKYAWYRALLLEIRNYSNRE